MRKVDYETIADVYDTVRSPEQELIDVILKGTVIDPTTRILDFGCGTGNYTNLLQRTTRASIYGVEPAQAMRIRAKEKNKLTTIEEGDHTHIPFADNYFDMIFTIDVIHHIPDIAAMLREFYRSLKPGGKVCIITQSHRQIDHRVITRYFPSTAIEEKKRYPEIGALFDLSEKIGFVSAISEKIRENAPETITDSFIQLIEKKGFSMFHLISDAEYQSGLESIKADKDRTLRQEHSGMTVVRFQKP